MDALQRYLSVYTNYNYPEYRFSTLWLLLGFVVLFPRQDGAGWVREAVVRILGSALGGGSVEFEQGLCRSPRPRCAPRPRTRRRARRWRTTLIG